MSVQTAYPSQLPSRVEATLLGRAVEATVVDYDLEATAGDGPGDILVLDVQGRRYRVPAADCDPV